MRPNFVFRPASEVGYHLRTGARVVIFVCWPLLELELVLIPKLIKLRQRRKFHRELFQVSYHVFFIEGAIGSAGEGMGARFTFQL